MSYDNAGSKPELHVVWRKDHKMVIMVTGLYHRTFLRLFEPHNYLLEHETLVISTYVYLPIFYIYLDLSLIVYVMHWIGVSKILRLS